MVATIYDAADDNDKGGDKGGDKDGDKGGDQPKPTPPREPPDELHCPLTYELMIDPVMVVETGMTYERKAIEEWLAKHDTDPMTGTKLEHKMLAPNVLVRGMCRKFSEGGS